MENDKLKQLKDKCFKANNAEEWKVAVNEIATALEGENDGIRNYLRKYCKDLLPKKKAFWEKSKNRPIVNKYILQDNLANALTEYLKVKTEILKKNI